MSMAAGQVPFLDRGLSVGLGTGVAGSIPAVALGVAWSMPAVRFNVTIMRTPA